MGGGVVCVWGGVVCVGGGGVGLCVCGGVHAGVLFGGWGGVIVFWWVWMCGWACISGVCVVCGWWMSVWVREASVCGGGMGR